MKTTSAEIYGGTDESQARAAFWQRHGSALAGKVYQLRRDVLSGYGPEKCRAGWLMEWRAGLGFVCRHREAACPSFRPNLHLLRLSDVVRYIRPEQRPGFQLGLSLE